ncbi:SDR family NAD(P)-dependent oxidoreductase [Paenibacillus sp. NAIST15-1]|uniref:SDR family NAD(P)-dependent oxidoreductase n=1 Tax=Paenibacillus sp. NAIST15-1 TaxID=1605994 RepID=UPI00086F0571|nr:SDR family NAD(P)-dependent oxidoreductase [Paenibacillus sp. NAIST15-1]GAV11579.1 DisB protein [Paenibacillus sp. NAIST15-1]
MPGQTKKTFHQIINDKNLIVRDHRVHDIRTLPGVTLLDLIYRLSTVYLDTQAIELRQVVFKQPIVTSKEFDNDVSVTFIPEQSRWKVTVTSQKMKGNTPMDVQSDENMECLLFLRGCSDSGHSLDVKAIMDNYTRKWDMDDIYGLARRVQIQHYGFMKTMGTVYRRDQEELMQLHLSDLAEKYRSKFYAHPAFLDGTTFAGATFRMDGTQSNLFEDRTPYIPFMIERFCIYKPLPATIYSYTKNTGTGVNSVETPDIISTDITIFNEEGTVLAEFEKLTVKRIREPQLIQKLVETDVSQTNQAVSPESPTQEAGHHSVQNTVETGNERQFTGDPKQRLITYLQKEIGGILNQSPDKIELTCGFYDLGLDSTNLLGLVKKLEQTLGQQFYPTLLFEYSNIQRLADFLLENSEDLSVLASSLSGSPQVKLDGVRAERDSATSRGKNNHELLYLQPIWCQQNLNRRNEVQFYDQHLIILDDPRETLRAEIMPLLNQANIAPRVMVLNSEDEDIPSQVEVKFNNVLAILKEQLKSKSNGGLLVQVIGDAGEEGKYIHVLGGLFKSAFQENPKIHSQIITMEQFRTQSVVGIARLLKDEAEAAEKGAAEICYQGEELQRCIRKWKKTKMEAVHCATSIKENGVYVITGGMGGLGLILAEYITRQAKVKLALIGRSKLSIAKEEHIQRLRQKGAEVLYVEADLGKQVELANALTKIRNEFGSISGIFHSSGVLRDQLIIHKKTSEIHAVFQPKVQGLWNLDQLTREEPLDFIVLFSSTSAALGNLGQADYASANAFMDIFAANRQKMVQCGLRHGRTFTINWPLWADGGMRVDDGMEQIMYSTSGLKSLPVREGMTALGHILGLSQTQTMVLYGVESKIDDFISPYLISIPESRDSATMNQGSVNLNSSSVQKALPSQYSQDDIAIIGLAGRYPMAENIEQFYQNLRDGKDCISGIPKERWKNYEFTLDVDQFYNHGGFIEGIDEFDPLFFNISPRQAELMDPQARLFLEIAWAACEDAGFYQNRTEHHYPSLSDQSVGVFAGVFWSHYELFAAEMAQKYGTPLAFGISPASISNMVSYCMNFHGPSVAVDTMCSSALTAIHLACESIRKHECNYAIAGGVNLVTHPHKYMFLKQAQFLASDGHCRSFGADGDGYVPGEGVGAVLLTTLERAKQEGYPIYAVIKGSEMNHGGKTSGFSVPDPVAQAEVITRALNNSGIHPRTIGYVEAHGTGTSLGDPIEIQGLKKAYGRWTNDQQFCAIGSSKSNVGHLEAAAGIAGLTKLLLQLKYGEIFPSLHAEKLNPYIPFDNTPFFVVRELSQWKPTELEVDGEKVTYPRRAGLSSFGAGGSNVHIILEEYQAEAFVPEQHQEPEILVLSARNEDRLREKARQLEKYLMVTGTDVQFGNVAYTLQIGREAMEARLAIVARTPQELQSKLSEFLAGKADSTGVFWNDPTRAANPSLLIKQEQEDLEYVTALIRKGNLEKIAALWTFGSFIPWERLFRDRDRSRVSLPSYPFIRERYWLPEPTDQAGTKGTIRGLHPLIDFNDSTFEEQRFVKVLNGSEYFLKDHCIDGNPVVPGVIYLEMARVAGKLANCGNPVKVLKDIIWATPLVMAGAPQEVNICLYPDGDLADFEIVTIGANRLRTIHAQGRIGYGDEKSTTETTELDIESIKQRCHQNVNYRDFYREFTSYGFTYGSSFQAVRQIWNSETEAISYLEFPEEMNATLSEYNWHPSMMDGAFQTVSRLIPRSARGGEMYLPFALEELEFIQSLPQKCYAHTEIASEQARKSGTLKYNITLTDPHGRILVRMRGFTVKQAISHQLDLGGNVSQIYYKPEWVAMEAKQVRGSKPEMVILFDLDEELKDVIRLQVANVILIKPGKAYRVTGEGTYEIDPYIQEDYRRLLESLYLQHWESCRIVYRWSQRGFSEMEAEIRRELDLGIYGLFLLTQALMEQKTEEKIRLFYVYESTDAGEPHHGAVSGFAKALHRENHRFLYKIVELRLERPGLPEELARNILAEMETGDSGVEIRYQQGIRYVKRLAEAQVETENHRNLPLKKHGVYVITGGAGGLGLIFATYLAREFQAKLVLTGRSPLTKKIAEKLHELEALGAEVIYVSADVTDRDEVMKLVQNMKAQFGALHGVIHSAGLLRDSFVLKKNRTEMEEVLGPKVFGTKFLDEATADEKLDFFVLFSSTAAEFGNLGQSDYAFGNSYMDYFSKWREAKGRPGKSLSINWPLWRDGGMQVGENLIAQMKETTGLIPLLTETGIMAFETALRQPGSQIMILEGNATMISALIEEKPVDVTANQTGKAESRPSGLDLEDANLRDKTEEFLKKILGRQIKLPMEKIHSREPLEKYGIDSVTVLNVTRELEQDFGELSKTLFFEYQTIAELTGYFLQRFPRILRGMLGDSSKASTKEPVVSHENLAGKIRRPRFQSPVRDEASAIMEDIAIIGVSGRYPMARDVDEFWENLRSGKDCITEIPPQRWDWRDFPGSCKWGGFIDNVDKFDPLFFNITPRVAHLIDPQERLFLETVWNTVEDAGYTRAGLWNQKVGVFVGVMYGQYQLLGAEESLKGHIMATNSIYASIANRVSYYFNFHGPSIALDTMCSSSLTAIHLACESIRRGESEVAVAGGVNVTIHPDKYISLSQGSFTSSDGRCRSFGEGGDGYVPGEGVGAILLKPLQRAIADQDRIYAVIKGSSVNHGGKTNGYTVPNPNAQTEIITETLKKARIDPRTISYIEAHGTGTSLGDPIEITGLMKAFGESTQAGQYCSVGSVKSNIGHLESAAGIAGITKLLLQFKHKKLAPSIHSQTLNPYIQFQNTPFYIQQELTEWERPLIESGGVIQQYPRRAGISAFGAGGSNAHIILEEYDSPDRVYETERGGQEQLFVFSARNPERLKESAQRMVKFLQQTIAPKSSEELIPDGLPERVRKDMVRIAAELLQINENEVAVTNEIADFGLNQVDLANLAQRINEYFNMEISLAVLSESRSLDAVSQYIIQTFPELLKCRYPSETMSPEINEHRAAPTLTDIAYTLQAAREPMEERMVIIAATYEELTHRLIEYCRGTSEVSNLYSGNIQSAGLNAELLLSGREGREYLRIIIDDRQLDKLAQLWISGVEIDWNLLYPHGAPQRISLPLYPFAGERYWVTPSAPRREKTSGQGEGTRLHPLIDRNESNMDGLRFIKTIHSAEIFLNDYQLCSDRLMLGILYLEMARVAGNIANPHAQVKKLSQIILGLPVSLADDKLLEIRLYPGGSNVQWEIAAIMNDNRKSISAQGEFLYEGEPESGAQPIGAILPVKAIQTRCPNRAAGLDFYRTIATCGLEYGPSLRGVHEIFSQTGEALVRFQQPTDWNNDSDLYLLHPSWLEAVLQTITWLLSQNGQVSKIYLLYSIAEIEFTSKLPNQGYIHVTQSKTSEQEFDAVLAAEDGRQIIQIRGLTVNEFESSFLPPSEEPAQVKELLQRLEAGELDVDLVNEIIIEKLIMK